MHWRSQLVKHGMLAQIKITMAIPALLVWHGCRLQILVEALNFFVQIWPIQENLTEVRSVWLQVPMEVWNGLNTMQQFAIWIVQFCRQTLLV
jgi:hypothetical protein